MEGQESSSIASRLSPDTLRKLLKLQSTLPNYTPLSLTETQQPKRSDELFEQVNTFLQSNGSGVDIIPRTDYISEDAGLTERITAIVQEHYGDSLPVIHFTNAAVGNNLDSLVSTGFVERFMDKGSVGKLHVGAFKVQRTPGGQFQDMSLENDSVLAILEKARDVAKEFHHHGLRTNKNQLGKQRGAHFSLPMALLFPKPDRLLRGTDNYDHWIMKDAQGNEKILSIVALDPDKAIGSIVEDRKATNNVVKQLIHGLGMYRLHLLQHQFNKIEDPNKKEQMALYGHDLVDAYLITRDDYDRAFDFNHLDPSVQDTITNKREKYNLFNQ